MTEGEPNLHLESRAGAVRVCLSVWRSIYLSICLSVLCVYTFKDMKVCVCVWLSAQCRRSCRRYLVRRSDCAGVFFCVFGRNSVAKKQQFGTPGGAKINNFGPLKYALMPYANKEAGRGFFWDLFEAKSGAKLEPGSVQVCDAIFEDVKKLLWMEFGCFSKDSGAAKVGFLIERCYKNQSLAQSSIRYSKKRF